MSVDTLTLAQRLRASELPAAQAEASAAAIGAAVLQGAATREDLQQVKLELNGDLQAMEARVEAKIGGLHARLLTWFIGSQVVVGALIVALIKVQF